MISHDTKAVVAASLTAGILYVSPALDAMDLSDKKKEAIALWRDILEMIDVYPDAGFAKPGPPRVTG